MAVRFIESETEQAYKHIKSVHNRVNNYTSSVIEQVRNGCFADKVLEIVRVYRDCLAEFSESENIVGIGALAKSIEGIEYDVVAEHNSVKAKMIKVQAHILNTIPKQNGYLLIWQLNEDFTTTVRRFTAAQTESLVSLLQDVIT